MKNEKELIEEIKKQLDQDVNDLDSGTLSEIRKARINALEQKRKRWILRPMPVGWVAVAILVMIVAADFFMSSDNKQISQQVKKVENKQVTPNNNGLSGPPAIAKYKQSEKAQNGLEIMPDQVVLIEMLSDEKELELYENMEFYSWVVEDASSSG